MLKSPDLKKLVMKGRREISCRHSGKKKEGEESTTRAKAEATAIHEPATNAGSTAYWDTPSMQSLIYIWREINKTSLCHLIMLQMDRKNWTESFNQDEPAQLANLWLSTLNR